KLYETQLGQKVSLDLVWELANRITEKYRNAGYFLSRAFVPTQKIEDGIITLRVVEGYIATVEWEGDLKNRVAASSIVQSLIAELKQVRPLNSASIESYLLRLNDLPGLSFRSFINHSK
ncbi:MAG: POTRA domain-containing protein, partial [bacterium]